MQLKIKSAASSDRRRLHRGLLDTAAALLVGWVVLVALPASAELYRYKNEDGITVLDSHVPARYVKDGYTILSLDGRVLEVVERALTEQEVLDRNRIIAANEANERAKQARQSADQNLLKIYGSAEDVIRARDTKLSSVKKVIVVNQANLQRLLLQKVDLETELANLERSGRSIPADRLEHLRDLVQRINVAKVEIKGKHQELDQLSQTYAADLLRLRELKGEATTR